MRFFGYPKPRVDGLGGQQRCMQARMMEAGLPEAAATAWCRVLAYACRGVCWWRMLELMRREYVLASMEVPVQLAGFFERTHDGLILTAEGHAWVAARAGKENFEPLMDTDKH